ncbi:hypothetical protein MaudCBS49596_004726 [Microsporum audouinii]
METSPATMKRRLLHGEISYSAAKDKEVNLLHRLEYFEKQSQFIADLAGREQWIKGVVAHHLNIDPSRCSIAHAKNGWFWGSFNLCIPVTIRDWTREQQPGDRVLLRLPLLYKVGEAFRPGNADEKIRCEASTYAWLQENHPHIPIPRLYGFSLSSGESFTVIRNLPFLARFYYYIRRQIYLWFSNFLWSRSIIPSHYVRHQPTLSPPSNLAYLLIECIEPKQGTMLSDTWFKNSNNAALRTTLFRSLARIMLSFTRVPLPLGLYDSRLLYQPNAINNGSDYIQQAATLAGIRLSTPIFFRRDLRRGLFIFSLTDLHQSNIFVDENWNITSLIDLEWGCSLPVEMIQPPYWLTSEFADAIDEDEYKKMWTEFVHILAQEEDKYFGNVQQSCDAQNTRLSTIMTKAWDMGTFWYSLALRSPAAIFRLFLDRIQIKLGKDNYSAEEYGLVMTFQWRTDVADILAQKMKDRKTYDDELRQAFLIPQTES